MDEINVKYNVDVSGFQEAQKKSVSAAMNIEQSGKKAFKGIEDAADKAVPHLERVSQAAAKAGRQFNGLNNSVNQIGRELPNFALNMNTGFLAISNNLPILFDELNRVKAANAELAAQGQKTTSVLGSLASAVFSWQTALTIGVTLLTVYGGKIVEMIKNFFNAKRSAESMLLTQKELNEMSRRAQVDTIKEITGMELLLKTAKSSVVTLKDRKAAVDELQKIYPAYFGNLTKEQILTGETADAEARLKDAILAKARAQAATSKIIENETLILDLLDKKKEADNKVTVAQIQLQKELARAIGDRSTKEGSGAGALGAQDRLNSAKEHQTNIDKQILAAQTRSKELSDIVIGNQGKINSLKTEQKKIQEDTLQRQLDFEAKLYDIRQKGLTDELTADTKAAKDAQLDKEREFRAQMVGLNADATEGEIKLLEEAAEARKKDNEGKVKASNEITAMLWQANKTQIENERKARELRNKENIEGALSIANSLGEINASFYGLSGANATAFADFQKAIALANIPVQIAEAIVGLTKLSFSTGNPITAFATLIAGVAAITTQVANAYQLLGSSATPTTPRFQSNVTTHAETGFASGVVDLSGPGTTKSDSIRARLSRGESVITAEGTANKKDELRALNHSVLNYEALIQDKYVRPALEAEKKKQQSFAENIAEAIHLHNAMEGKTIVKAIKDNRPASKKDIQDLGASISKSHKETFLQKNHAV